mgnify:CR=1 FL=1
MIKSTAELKGISDILAPLGFSLDEQQLHIGGERYLMMKNKMVLTGIRNSDKLKVVIKVSNHPDGKKEIETEKKSRDTLQSLSFASDTLSMPEEIYYSTQRGYLIFITRFISQEKVFVDHDLEDQFFMILRAFEAQEAFHMTTFEHEQSINKTFQVWLAKDYLRSFKEISAKIGSKFKETELAQLLSECFDFIKKNEEIIEKYSNYLTHTDFVPHNFRISKGMIYMLDGSAVQFGNKHEGWARLLNYMVIHNPNLEKLLLKYIEDNFGQEEYLNLKLMRIYKIAFLISYYVQSLSKTEGDLHKLTMARIDFWFAILKSIIHESPLDQKILDSYIKERDSLRSEEEKKRQKEFAKA